MSYVGDFALGSTFDVGFTSRQFSTGAPFTLAGSPAVAAYPDNSTTEITAGITLSTNFDSRTGLNNVRVVATSGNGYAAGVNYKLVLTAGTVDSVSVVGEVIAHFSIEARSALRPGTAGRTLAVESDGMAHADVKEWLGTAPNALQSGRVGANMTAIGDNADAATRQRDGALALGYGVVDTDATTTEIPTKSLHPPATVANQLSGRRIVFRATTATAALRGQAASIASMTDTGVLTLVAEHVLTTAPAEDDEFDVF